MGIPFFEHTNKKGFHCSCILCSTIFVKNNESLITTIDTPEGTASSFPHVMNINEDITSTTNGFLNMLDEKNALYDNNAPFNTFQTGLCISLHCRFCNLHVGWKTNHAHGVQYILLKDKTQLIRITLN